MHSKESMEVEEMVEAGLLPPPDTEEGHREAYLDLWRRYDEWKEKMDRELREKGELE